MLFRDYLTEAEEKENLGSEKDVIKMVSTNSQGKPLEKILKYFNDNKDASSDSKLVFLTTAMLNSLKVKYKEVTDAIVKKESIKIKQFSQKLKNEKFLEKVWDLGVETYNREFATNEAEDKIPNITAEDIIDEILELFDNLPQTNKNKILKQLSMNKEAFVGAISSVLYSYTYSSKKSPERTAKIKLLTKISKNPGMFLKEFKVAIKSHITDEE